MLVPVSQATIYRPTHKGKLVKVGVVDAKDSHLAYRGFRVRRVSNEDIDDDTAFLMHLLEIKRLATQ